MEKYGFIINETLITKNVAFIDGRRTLTDQTGWRIYRSDRADE